MTTRRELVGGLVAAQLKGAVTKYVRFRKGNGAAFGMVDGDIVHELKGDLFGDHKPSGAKHKLAETKLLYPIEPPKVLAVGLNYKSHVGERPTAPNPEIFYKPVTCLQHPGEPIVIPADSKNLHYEGELVLIIGKGAKNVSKEEAKACIFGVTCGNDVSERDWQGGPKKDLQWWRAKGANTFGPLGPWIVRGLDYGNLMLQTRLNGNVVQKQSTADLIFDCPSIVSFISRYVTLTPGDVIYTGTPGRTSAMKQGDTVEVDIEGIGVLKNPLVAG